MNIEGSITQVDRKIDLLRSNEQTNHQREHIQRVLQQTTVPLEVQLGRATLTIDQILKLKRDDVLMLDQLKDEPLVGERNLVKLYGQAGRSGRKYGFLINEVTPDGQLPSAE